MARECAELPRDHVIAEPRPRNTAPAVGVAACVALEVGGPSAAVAVLPSDHVVVDPEAFLATLAHAFEVAEAEPLVVTLGMRPDRPETGYGYVTRGEALRPGVFRIERFHEKPDIAGATDLVHGGRSYWNAGIFVAAARTILDELTRHAPEIGGLLANVVAEGPLRGARENGAAFAALYERAPSVSFDHAVMERTCAGAVVPAEFGWDDVGSWEAMARLLERDAAGNAVRGAARLADASDNILFAEEGRITVIGASNLVVVRSGAETLVCSRDRLPELRELLKGLNGSGGR